MGQRSRFAELRDAIHAGVDDDEAWTESIAALADTFRARSAGVGVQDMATHAFRGCVNVNMPPPWPAHYAEKYARCNSIWRRIAQRPLERAVADWMVVDKNRFVTEPLYQGWFKAQGLHSVMAVPVLKEDSRSGVVVLFRTEDAGEFTEEDVAFLSRLGPPLRHVVDIRRRLEQGSVFAEALQQLSDGVLLLDGERHLLWANRAAERILREADGLRCVQGKVGCVSSEAHAEFRTAVKDAAGLGSCGGGGRLAVPRPAGRLPFDLRVAPFRPSRPMLWSLHGVAIVFVRDPGRIEPPPAELLSQLYKLTPKDTRIALAFLERSSRKEVANELGLNDFVVRDHLTRIFRKTGTHRVVELVRLLLRLGFSPKR